MKKQSKKISMFHGLDCILTEIVYLNGLYKSNQLDNQKSIITTIKYLKILIITYI